MAENWYRSARQTVLAWTATGGAICVLLATHAARESVRIGTPGQFTEAMFPWSVIAGLCGIAILKFREPYAVSDRFDVLGVAGVVLLAPLVLGLLVSRVHPLY